MIKKFLILYLFLFRKILCIDHLVVLMLENRSFDHMLGFLKKDIPQINGCLPHIEQCSNIYQNQTIFVSDNAPYVEPNPSHSCNSVLNQMYGFGKRNQNPSPMSGFIQSYDLASSNGKEIMECFNPNDVPAITTLAKEFAVVNNWFSSMPGPTFTNRMFANSATSHGLTTHNKETIIKGVPQRTIMELLDLNNKSWKVYFHDFPLILTHDYPRHPRNLHKFKYMKQFYEDAKSGNLPTYSWIEPRYLDHHNSHANDQHPNHDVALGEHLIADIYEALRQSPKWIETLFLITYDEHGGFFDHVSPPYSPNPDNLVDKNVPFDFKQLGVRVPAILVSPLIPKGTIITSPYKGQYEHSSITSTIRKLFTPNEPSLNKRDDWAATFEHVLTLKYPRKDCPKTLTRVENHRKLTKVGLGMIEGLAQEIVDLASAISGKDINKKMKEFEASEYISNISKEFLNL